MYDQFSEEYDRFVNWKNRLDYELPFITSEIQKAIPKPGPEISILDTATGTGMHAIALAQKGYRTFGVDISAGMVEKARQNARSLGVETKFAVAGFGNTVEYLQAKKSDSSALPNDLFDVVLCLGNSLPHVEGMAELNAALFDFANCLKPEGLLIVQSRNFDAVLISKERWMEPQSFINNKGEWLYVRTYDFLPDGHVQFNIIILSRAHRTGNWNQSVMETRLFPILKSDMFTALEALDFSNIHAYGSLANIPFDEKSSGNLVITARNKK
jgi:glycine/sarcosine N-methyltransferase